MAYTRRKPLAECRWPNASQTTLSIEWSNEMAYIVGLTATDGCLISGKRDRDAQQQQRLVIRPAERSRMDHDRTQCPQHQRRHAKTDAEVAQNCFEHKDGSAFRG